MRLPIRLDLRVSAHDAARLRELAARLPALPRSVVARLALRAGLAQLERDPAAALVRPAARPTTNTPPTGPRPAA